MSFDPHENPYAAKPVEQKAVSDVESIRRQHLSHEASIKSMGLLFMLAGVVALLVGLVYFVLIVSSFLLPNQARDTETLALLAVIATVAAAIGIFQLVVAIGLRKLAPWAKIPAVALAGIGLLGFPLGTLINGYFIYLLLCQKGSTVFSEDYRSIIAQTPHIKYKTSIIVWIFVGLLLALMTVGIVAAIFG